MGLDDWVGSPVVGAAAAAVALSPRVRGAARQGAVYGLAGVLKAGDVVVGAGRGMVQGVAEGARGEGRPDADAAGETSSGGESRSTARGRRAPKAQAS